MLKLADDATIQCAAICKIIMAMLSGCKIFPDVLSKAE